MSRSFENEIEIAAPPADVWRALTDGEELARWFAVAAEVEPGEGGCWKVSWDESPVVEVGKIQVWEPGRHLRLAQEGVRGAEAVVRIEDFELVALDGGARTLLRIVSSGFGSDASWDDEFEGTKNGWAVFIRNLRHYLERHAGQRCRSVGFPFAGLALSKPEAFARLFGVGGVLPIAEPLEEGRRVEIATSFGKTIHATIDFARPPALLGLAVDGLGLVRAEFVGSERLFVHVMLLAHGDDFQAALDAIGKPLSGAIASALEAAT
jgi:uncharacterized protein YndB with AHSA1/START domain